MKKAILWVIIVIIIIGGIWYFSGRQTTNRQTTKKESIKIGVVLPLTGTAAYYGIQAQNGVEIAKEYIRQKYPHLGLDIYYEDSFYTPKGAVDAYQSLKSLHQIDAVIPLASHVSMAIQPLSNKDNVLEMAIASTAGKYSTPDDLSFRTIPSIEVQAAKIADFLQRKGYKKVGLLYANNDFGVGGKEALKNQIQKQSADIKIVSDESFLMDTSDFRTHLLKLKGSSPNAVYLVGTAANYINILTQAKEMELKTQFVSISSTEDPSLLKNAADVAEGIIYTYYAINPDVNIEARNFVDAYKTKYNELPDGYAAEGYEALRLVIQSFQECDKNAGCIKDYLENLKDYKSVFGNLSFDKNGDVYYDFIFKTIRNGQFVPLED